jgi:hypothetical protein
MVGKDTLMRQGKMCGEADRPETLLQAKSRARKRYGVFFDVQISAYCCIIQVGQNLLRQFDREKVQERLVGPSAGGNREFLLERFQCHWVYIF